MPKDKLARFKLIGNNPFPTNYTAFRADRTVRRFCKMISTYRQEVHGAPSELPKPLVYVAHYFAIPMTKSDSDNPRDRRGIAPEAPPKQTLTERMAGVPNDYPVEPEGETA